MSLTKSLAHDRIIKVTERANLHLVTHSGRIHLKPLPDYLLSNYVWTSHIKCNLLTYEAAYTLLWSYTKILVLLRSDFQIAQSHGLLNQNFTWSDWASMARKVNQFEAALNIRWIYGEFRLKRLNWIYRLLYMEIYYKQPGRDWLIGLLIYVTIVLTVMQVGLATNHLQSDLGFQRALYGFAVFNILAPLIILFIDWGYQLGGAIVRKTSSKIAHD